MFKAIIFDFDGTLVDSRPGILFSMKHAVCEIDDTLIANLNQIQIGPPLTEVANILFPRNITLQNIFIAKFKAHYDSIGVYKTVAYDGVEKTLKHLKENKIKLYIATNKRQKPTYLILEKFNWLNLFSEVHCIDNSNGTPPKSKSEMVKSILESNLSYLDNKSTALIGDTSSDYNAANNNNIKFLWAIYGYGDEYLEKIKSQLHQIASIKELAY